MDNKTIFTTGEAAKICKVSQQTIIRCFDSGQLKGFRVPGSRSRRIPHTFLEEFMMDNGIPMDGLPGGDVIKVLLVSTDDTLASDLKQEFPKTKLPSIAVATNSFEAGVKVESFHPGCVIVDFSIGGDEATQVCNNLRNSPVFSNIVLIGLIPNTCCPIVFNQFTLDKAFRRPFVAASIVEQVLMLVKEKRGL